MIVAGPNVRKNMTIKSKVYLHDLAATFLDYAGAQHPSKMDAKSLRPLLEGQQEQIHDVIVSGLHLKHRYYETVYDGRYKFANDNGEVLLFDLQSDPKEEKNIINEQPELLIKLKQHSLHVAKLM